MESLYENESYRFELTSQKNAGAGGVRIVRVTKQTGEEVVLFDYFWPVQLRVEITAEKGDLREDGVLCWQLHVTAHHTEGKALGEFTETEWFEVDGPFESADRMNCKTVDIIRKTRFAAAERHLKHLPHQTYPAVDGKQGPYGHPSVNTQGVRIPKR